MESHAAHHPPVDGCATEGTNAWRLAEVLDAWGMSLFPRWQFPIIYHAAAKYEITRSNAAGKPFYLTELEAGHGNEGLWRSPKMRPRDIRVYNWLAVAMGAKGIIYWNYQAEATGREATGYGLVARSGAATDRSKEAAKNNAIIQAHWDVIKDFHPRTEVVILPHLRFRAITRRSGTWTFGWTSSSPQTWASAITRCSSRPGTLSGRKAPASNCGGLWKKAAR
jgi:hypothetical protein